MSQQLIATVFSITQRQVSRYCEQVRSDLKQFFVPSFLGANQMTREKWLEHNTVLVKELFFSNELQGNYFVKSCSSKALKV